MNKSQRRVLRLGFWALAVVAAFSGALLSVNRTEPELVAGTISAVAAIVAAEFIAAGGGKES